MRAWRMRDQCLDPGCPWPWLATICRREAARLAARRRPSPLPEEHEPLEPSRVEDAVERLAVSAAVAELPLIDQELISRRYVQDQTYERIAFALAMPEGTVKVRLHRARRRLGQVLEA